MIHDGPSGSFTLEMAPTLLLVEAPELRSSGNRCGLADGRRSQCFPEEFRESSDDDFSIGRLTSALLGSHPEQAFFVHAAAQAGKEQIPFVIRQEGASGNVKPQSDARAHLVDVLPSRPAASGCRERQLTFGDKKAIRDPDGLVRHQERLYTFMILLETLPAPSWRSLEEHSLIRTL